MNILISICKDFLQPVKVMLYSIAQEHNDLNVYLLYSSLTQENIIDLKLFLSRNCNAKLYPICADGYFQKVPLSEQYPKPELYYRLVAPYILPKDLDRILYLDADIIVTGSLDEFYHQDFEDNYIAVIKDRFDFCDEVVAQKKKLGLKDEDVYFNSGVILFDLPAFRENISFQTIIDFIQEKQDDLYYFDQDTLNCILKEHKKLCDLQYNFQAYPFEELHLEEVIDSSIVVHFTDQPKPWNPQFTGSLAYLFWKYAIKAGFTEEFIRYWYDKEEYIYSKKKEKKSIEQNSK